MRNKPIMKIVENKVDRFKGFKYIIKFVDSI